MARRLKKGAPRVREPLIRMRGLESVSGLCVFVLGPFESRDLLDVMRLSTQTLGEEYPFTFFTQMAASQGKHFRVARKVEDGQVIGFLVAARQPALQGRILLFSVDPDFQGLGIGRALLRDAQRALVLDDVRSLQLEVRPDNARAIEFYQRHGFNVSRVQAGAYRDGSDALLMTKPLL